VIDDRLALSKLALNTYGRPSSAVMAFSSRPTLERQVQILQHVEARDHDQRLAIADREVPALEMGDGHGSSPKGVDAKAASTPRSVAGTSPA
jgi:hypothetical protein